MSDSEENELTSNIFTYRTNDTIISASGPSSNSLGGSNQSVCSKFLPNNRFQGYARSYCNEPQSHRYRKRATSPMSTMSVCQVNGMSYNNLHAVKYQRGINSQRSTYNGRCGSPNSVRSIDSSVSAVTSDILRSIKNEKFKDDELKIMLHEIKNRIKYRGKIKRKNMKRLPKYMLRERSGSSYDSRASSSLSSSDESFTKGSMPLENMSSCGSARTMSDFKTVPGNNMFRGQPYRFQQSYLQRDDGPGGLNNTHTSISSFRSATSSNNYKMPYKPNHSSILQKDRFNRTMLLPSQRFNKSIAYSTISEGAKNTSVFNMSNRKMTTESQHSTSEHNVRSTSTTNDTARKRSIDSDDDLSLPSKKKHKNHTITEENEAKENNSKLNDFIFTKPSNPVRRSANTKNKKNVSKPSAYPFDPQTLSLPKISPDLVPQSDNVGSVDNKKDHEQEISDIQSTSDLSMQPSFIKRKLFTQKLDILEKKNISTENLTESPQPCVYSMIEKEKHKSRKLQLSTTRSCLSRDVAQDDNNVLDLIKKIVPQNKFKVTNQANTTDVQKSDESETYTDEEIFNMTKDNVTQEPLQNVKDSNVVKLPADTRQNAKKSNVIKLPADTRQNAKESNVVKLPAETRQNAKKSNVVKLPADTRQNAKESNVVKPPADTHTEMDSEININSNDGAKTDVQKKLISFWDTDCDSDMDIRQPCKNNILGKIQNKDSNSVLQNKEVFKFQATSNLNNTTNKLGNNISLSLNNTFGVIQKFNNTTLRLKSHRTTEKKEFNKSKVRENKEGTPRLGDFSKVIRIELKKMDPTDINLIQKSKGNKIVAQQDTCGKTSDKMNSSANTQNTSIKEKTARANTKKQIKTPNNKESTTNKKETITKRSSPRQINNSHMSCKKSIESNSSSKILTNNNTSDQEDKQSSNDKSSEKVSKAKMKNNKNAKGTAKNKKESLPSKDNSRINEDDITEVINTSNRAVRACRNKVNICTEDINTSQRAVRGCRKKVNIFTEDLNTSRHSLRSCRNNTSNKTNNDNSFLNDSLCRTLRSRQVDLSSINDTSTTVAENKRVKLSKLRSSDVSFALNAGEKILTKKSALRQNRWPDSAEVDTSNVSFSLQDVESPAKNAVAARSRNNVKRQNSFTNTANSMRNMSQGNVTLISKYYVRPIRSKRPNKRYLKS